MKNSEKIAHYAKMLDEKHWLRLVVLFSPGMLAMKIATTLSAPSEFRLGATVLLGAGLAIYALWGRLKSKVLGIDDETGDADTSEGAEVEERRPSANAEQYAGLMKRLVAMCEGDSAAALALIEDECVVNPDQDYLTAIELAYRRKERQVKRQSGSSR